jgi:ankyrin repeat protein
MVIFFTLFFTETPLRLLDPMLPPSITSTIFHICDASLQIAALILLFQRDSSDWFKAIKVWRRPQKVSKTWQRGLQPGEALIEAARRGDMRQIEHLLTTGADVNAQNKWGLTPLMAAAHGGHIVAGKLLLEKGADVNTTQHGGWTALMVAAVKGHLDVVNLLLKKGVDVNARTESRLTALTLARSNGRSQVAELLKAHGGEA